MREHNRGWDDRAPAYACVIMLVIAVSVFATVVTAIVAVVRMAS